MIRRISILGGPGVGKSTFSAKLYSYFKSQGYNVELAREYIKKWVYCERTPVKYEQVYILGKQLQEEFLPLKNGVELIISDSPLFLSYYYSMEMGNTDVVSESIFNIVSEFDKEFPSINILLERKFDYVESGRFHTEEQANQIQESLVNLLWKANKDYIQIDPSLEDSEKQVFDYFLERKWSPYA